MPCIGIDLALPLPTLPFPLTLGIGLPQFSFDPKLCCKLLPFPLATPPISFGIAIMTPAVVAVIMAQLAALHLYVDLLPFDCPFE